MWDTRAGGRSGVFVMRLWRGGMHRICSPTALPQNDPQVSRDSARSSAHVLRRARDAIGESDCVPESCGFGTRQPGCIAVRCRASCAAQLDRSLDARRRSPARREHFASSPPQRPAAFLALEFVRAARDLSLRDIATSHSARSSSDETGRCAGGCCSTSARAHSRCCRVRCSFGRR
jgi:hypothetical protein